MPGSAELMPVAGMREGMEELFWNRCRWGKRGVVEEEASGGGSMDGGKQD